MNNTTNSSKAEDLDMTSLTNLLHRMPADVTFIFVGLITSILNLMTIVTIASSKRLQTKCYFLIANESVAAIIYSFSFVITAIKRIVRVHLRISEVKSKLGCNGEMFISYFGQSACAALPLVTAIDRLMATLVPVKYKNFGKRVTVMLTLFGWGYALVDSGFTFYGSNMDTVVLNCNMVSTTDLLYIVQSSCAIAIALLVVVLYVCVMVVMKYRNKTAKTDNLGVAEIKAKLQMKVAKSLSVDSCIQLVTQVSTRIGLALLPLFPDADKWTSASYMRIIIFSGLCCTFFIFLCLNTEFRKSFFRLIPFVKHKIHPVEMVSNFFVSIFGT